MRYGKTEWGVRLTVFSQRYGITLRKIAELSGVSYSSMLQTSIGKATGQQNGLIDKVNAFMADFESKNDPLAARPMRSYI